MRIQYQEPKYLIDLELLKMPTMIYYISLFALIITLAFVCLFAKAYIARNI